MKAEEAKGCPVCEHPERGPIDGAMRRFGQAPRSVARRYSGTPINRRTLARHRDECLASLGHAEEGGGGGR